MALPWYIVIGLTFVALYFIRFKRQYLAGPDSVFISGDPHGVIVVHAVLTTKKPVPFAFFKKVLTDKIASHLRFQQKIVRRRFKWHYFELDTQFSLDRHIRIVKLQPKSQSPEDLQCALEEFTSIQIQTPIKFDRPPWEFIFIERHGEGSAIIFRVHHAIADGMTLMRIAMSIFAKAGGNDEPVEVSSPGSNFSPSPSPSPAPDTKGSKSPAPAASSSGTTVSHHRFHAIHKYKKPRVTGPKTPVEKVTAYLKALWYILTLPFDRFGILKPTTPITPNIPVNAQWLRQPFALSELKQLSYATGTSVNDILFYIVASALRTYCLQKGEPVSSLTDLKTIMWVSLQGTEVMEKIAFGNKIGAATIPLPVSIEEDTERLIKTRELTNVVQVSPEPLVASHILTLVGLLPQIITWPIWNAIAYKPTNSMSNVPGPPYAVTWGQGGPELDRMVFFVPPQGTISSFITILSYNDQVSMGFLSDSRAVGKPREVLDLFVSEYEKIKLKVDQLQKSEKLHVRLGLDEKHRHHA